MNSPFFSIIVPTFNRAHLITKTINSILQQHYKNYEIIIVDDGSTDNTLTVLQPFLNEKIKYLKKENAERAAARNYGTLHAKGDYINWFDSDDLMLPNHLEEAVKLIQQHNKPEILALSFIIATQHLTPIRKVVLSFNFCNDILYKENILACNPVFVRKDIALVFPFNENRILSASEDYELWLRLAAQFTIFTSPTITSTLIEHNERSVNIAAPKQKIIGRFETFLSLALSNKTIINFLKNKQSSFIARNYLLIAVTLGVNGYKKNAFTYFLRALFTYPFIVVQRQFYVFIKVILLKK